MKFAHFLGTKGVRVSSPIKNKSSNTYEIAKDGEAVYIATLMDFIEGNTPDTDDLMSDSKLVFEWGKLTGKMHKAAKEYPIWKNSLESDDRFGFEAEIDFDCAECQFFVNDILLRIQQKTSFSDCQETRRINMELVCDYMRDDTLRHALNELTRKTFCFDFEKWVTGGYFEGDYIPYSFMEEGKIISNVSANRMRFMQNGVIKNYIQIGTVMTDTEYRGKGLAGKLMKHVISQYEGECNGLYLFGNLSATGFYRKLMFQEGMQYRYFVKDELCRKEKAGKAFVSVKKLSPDIRIKYLEMVRNSEINSSFEQINKYGLQMFYTSDMDHVYYAEDMDCFIVLCAEENDFCLQSVLCKDKISVRDVLQRIDRKFDKVRLGFTPSAEDMKMCVADRYDGGEDYRFFYMGQDLLAVQNQRLYFPELSHA